MTFTLLPAVDVVDGQAVRLNQGAAGTEKSYGSPLDAAKTWQNAGATWLHFVDLDAAFGRGSNHELMADIIAQLDIHVELTGGIRDDATLERALATGARRVNIGTAALENPEWIAQAIATHGDKIAVDIAALLVDGEWRTRSRGWVDDGGDLWEILERLDSQGCQRFVVTTDAKIVASGGIAQLSDITELAKYEDEGIDSAIIGKALYEGRFTLPEALALL